MKTLLLILTLCYTEPDTTYIVIQPPAQMIVLPGTYLVVDTTKTDTL